jgi:hypothetical protein
MPLVVARRRSFCAAFFGCLWANRDRPVALNGYGCCLSWLAASNIIVVIKLCSVSSCCSMLRSSSLALAAPSWCDTMPFNGECDTRLVTSRGARLASATYRALLLHFFAV